LVRVTVPISGRDYEVTIGSDVIVTAGDHLPDLPGAAQAFVIADRLVADAWFPLLAGALSARGMVAVPLTVPAGEDAKTLQVHQTLLHQLATRSAHRSDIVVALGGGAVGDLAGFLAATYMRGLPFVQVPTTLTAQVDASVGGKTAVNLPEGKNLVGVFHQPVAVLADVGTLTTLPDRDFRSGLAEVAKYALTLDPALLADLEADPGPVLARDAGAMEELVARCVRLKAATVADDERDTGRRLVLNYGHTVGHALERLGAFGGRTHGEAIAVGMVFAARLAERLGRAAPGLAGRTVRLLSSLGLETHGPLPSAGAIVDAFALDKKYQGGVRFVVLEDVGRPLLVDDVPEPTIVEILEEMGAAA
jgi:3-dehydroquinate synthase